MCVCVYTVQWVAIVWILASVTLSGQLKWEEPQTMVEVLYCQKHSPQFLIFVSSTVS